MTDGPVVGFIQEGSLVRPDGLFSMMSITPGEYVIQVPTSMATAMGWTLTSITMEGQDILDVPIQLAANSISAVTITFSDRATELSGRVNDAEGRPQPGLTLVVFSADRRHWYAGSRRVRQALPDARGDYRVGGLPPGDYWLAAISGGLDLPNGLVAGLTELSSAAIRFSLALANRAAGPSHGEGLFSGGLFPFRRALSLGPIKRPGRIPTP